MLHTIQKLTFLLAIVMLVFIGYEAFFKDSAQAWQHFQEPELAAYASLEENVEIINKLKHFTSFNEYKSMDRSFFDRANVSVFQKVNEAISFELSG